jgi:hypothetical protein
MERDMREKPLITPVLVLGLLVAGAGVILFLDMQELIAAGALLAWRAIEAQQDERPGNSASFLNRWTEFGGGEVLAVCGGYSIDLRGASMAGPSAKDSRVAILTDGTRLPVSRAGYARLKALLGEK